MSTSTSGTIVPWARDVAWPVVGLAAPLAVIVGLMAAQGLALQSSGTGALINLVMVVGLYTFMGNSGVQSFGHIGFVAVGAYVSALLTIPLTNKAFVLPNLPSPLQDVHAPLVVSTLAAAGVAAVFAAVVAGPLMRLSGTAAGIASFALLIVVQNVASNWTDVTGGLGTLTGVPTDLTIWGAFWWAVGVMAVAAAYSRSRFGARLRASRDDDVAARAIGIKVERERRRAFVLSAAMMGIGGSLYAHRLGAFGPGDFYIGLTFVILAMLIVGGTRSLAGAVVGTVVVSVVDEVLVKWQSGQAVLGASLDLPTGTSDLFLSVVLLLILLRRPDGITGSREVPWSFKRRARSAAVSKDPAAPVSA
jgi:branched-chain amino acid transport system permease protein